MQGRAGESFQGTAGSTGKGGGWEGAADRVHNTFRRSNFCDVSFHTANPHS